MGEAVRTSVKVPEIKKENKVSQVQKGNFYHPVSSPVEQILFLQRTRGNQAVQRLMKSGGLQAKLRIGAPGDVYEQEADKVTDAFASVETIKVSAASGVVMQRQPLPDSQSDAASDTLIENASPFLAGALGSATLDHFDTGKSDLKPFHKTQLASVVHSIQILMRKYRSSTVNVIGYADTVGTKANNLQLGLDRANVVKQALSESGVSEDIISAESKGEGEPQGVMTKDEVPSAQNRRVEIRFHPNGYNLDLMMPQLKLPSAEKKSSEEYDQVEKSKRDFNYHHNIEPPDPTKPPPDLWKPVPPAPKGSGPKSPLDAIGEKLLDPVIDSVAGWLPKDLRDKIKKEARNAVKSGAAKGARAAAEAAGLKDPRGLEAIEKAVEAAIQEKGKTPQ